MPKLIITDRSGKKSEIEYDSNFTLMETLRDNGYDNVKLLSYSISDFLPDLSVIINFGIKRLVFFEVL